MYTNPFAKELLKEAGLTEGSEDYDIAVSLLARQNELSF